VRQVKNRRFEESWPAVFGTCEIGYASLGGIVVIDLGPVGSRRYGRASGARWESSMREMLAVCLLTCIALPTSAQQRRSPTSTEIIRRAQGVLEKAAATYQRVPALEDVMI